LLFVIYGLKKILTLILAANIYSLLWACMRLDGRHPIINLIRLMSSLRHLSGSPFVNDEKAPGCRRKMILNERLPVLGVLLGAQLSSKTTGGR